MAPVYAEITLINGKDLVLAKKHIIGVEKIKQMKVSMLAGSGACMMALNETIQEQLQLPVKERRKAQIANGKLEKKF